MHKNLTRLFYFSHEKDATENPDDEQLADYATNESSEPQPGDAEDSVAVKELLTGSAAHKTTKPHKTTTVKSISPSSKHHTVTEAATMLRPKQTHTSAYLPEWAPILAFLKQLQIDFDKLHDDFYDAMTDLKPEMGKLIYFYYISFVFDLFWYVVNSLLHLELIKYTPPRLQF